MDQYSSSYQLFLRFSIVLLLVGQAWATIVPYSHWLFDSDTELIERCTAEDSETEKEEQKEEKDEKLNSAFFYVSVEEYSLTAKLAHSIQILSLHHPEITTPPPQI